MADELNTGENTLDVRDLIERYEELEADKGAGDDAENEFNTLQATLDELSGGGGDHTWRGSDYPTGLVRESYFVEYVQELAEDIGAYSPESGSWLVIDWDKTAEGVKMDYSEVEIDGVTYLYR